MATSLSTLPADILRLLANYLKVKDVCRLRVTCKHINKSLCDSKLWLSFFKRDFNLSNRMISKMDLDSIILSYQATYLINKNKIVNRHGDEHRIADKIDYKVLIFGTVGIFIVLKLLNQFNILKF